MEYTKNYKLPQWVESDRIQMEDFNQMCANLDDGITAAQGTGDLGMRHLKSILWDLCHLAYQQDGKGTYTGWRESFDFDGLNTDHRVESTTGAAVLEPENGQVRLLTDGWTGGSVAWSSSYFNLAGGATQEFISEEWIPAGYAKTKTVTVNAYVDPTEYMSSYTPAVYLAVLRGDEVLATTNTQTISKTSGSKTYTFSSAVTLSPHETYQLKLVATNNVNNASYKVYVETATLATTAVKQTSGVVTTEAMDLTGAKVMAWIQYSAPGVVSVDLLLEGAWTAMELETERNSQTPEGTACTEGKFTLASSKEMDSVKLRININSESECMVYGYGVTVL